MHPTQHNVTINYSKNPIQHYIKGLLVEKQDDRDNMQH